MLPHMMYSKLLRLVVTGNIFDPYPAISTIAMELPLFWQFDINNDIAEACEGKIEFATNPGTVIKLYLYSSLFANNEIDSV